MIVASVAAQSQPADTPGAEPDTLVYHLLEAVEVTGDPLRLPVEAGPVELDASRIRDAGSASLAALASMLPSTRITVNSRCEGLFMLRGAPERHLPVFLEGIPLTLPWDERADLSMLGTLALGGLSARRGVESALQGAGALAGRVDLSVLRGSEEEPGTRIGFRAGEGSALQLGLVRLGKSENWDWTGAASHRRRRAWNLPDAYQAEFNQADESARNNSDLEQTAVLLHGRRARAGGGHWSLLLHALDGSKGVPPETHLADARFWGFPIHRRLLLGGRVVTQNPLWRSDASLSVDLFGQNIRPFEDANYEGGDPESGQEYEQDRDFTAFLSFRLDRKLGAGLGAGIVSSARYARHKESLIWRGSWQAKSQALFSNTVELRGGGEGAWRFRVGLGFENSSTPETGEAVDREGNRAGVFHAGLTRTLGQRSELKFAASRRSRFPSMREMFSTALGKFHPNPDLGPETQNLAELGCSMRGSRGEAWLGVFASQLEGGIEKIPFEEEGARFIRVNRDEIRVAGLEFMFGWRPRPGLHLGLQHSHFHSRAKEAGGEELPAEDRPDYLSRLSVAWTRGAGLRLRFEAAVTGPRQSAHPDEGLVQLPAEGSASLRVARVFRLERWARGSDLEIYLRMDNLFDSVLLSQIGLPEAGRTLQAGLNLALRN